MSPIQQILLGGVSGGGDPGSSSSNPITDFSAWKIGKTTADDGKYWVQLSSGSNTAFETYITLRNGGWMKVAQMHSNNNIVYIILVILSQLSIEYKSLESIISLQASGINNFLFLV